MIIKGLENFSFFHQNFLVFFLCLYFVHLLFILYDLTLPLAPWLMTKKYDFLIFLFKKMMWKCSSKV